MRNNFPGKRKAITLAVLAASISLPVSAQDDGVTVEEVVVTGSFIPGSRLDAPSPVQVIDRDSIEAQGAAVVWDVIKNLEVNSGSFANAGAGERSQTEGTAQVNLRNLGENSTLTLINGKRVAVSAATTTTGGEFVDINQIPLVMTDRVEVLTDGGSALYGADAVAGVVNVIMRTDFEGFELYGDIQGVEQASGAFDQTVSAIWGWSSDDSDTHFVLSGEYFERDAVNVLDANFVDEFSEFLGTTQSITAGTVAAIAPFGANVNPAYFRGDITAQNAAEGGRGTIFADPLCGTSAGTTGLPFQIGTLREVPGERSGTCREDIGRFSFITRDTQRASVAAAFDHTFSEAAEFYAFANYSQNEVILQGNGLNNDGGSSASRGPTVFLAAPGSTTGIPGIGVNVASTLELGYFAPNIGLARPAPGSITNAPVDIANGGINVAFASSVRDGIPRDGGNSNSTDTNATIIQAGLRGAFTVKERDWSYDVSYSWSNSSIEQSYQVFNRDRAELAANGLGGPNCTPNGVSDFDFAGAELFPGASQIPVPQAWDFFNSAFTQTFFPGFVFTTQENLSLALTSNNQGQGGCEFFNPFLTALDPNSNVTNSPELLNYLNQTVLRNDKRNKLAVIDAVVGGGLFDMRGGEAAFAAGFQYRDRNAKSIAPALNDPGLVNRILTRDANGVPNSFHDVSNNFECAQCIFNFDDDRDVTALFLELSLPFWDNVESQIALRYEDYGGVIGSELSPKVAVSWRPIEELIVRGSFSQSFRAPNVGIVEQGFEAGSLRFRDPISNQAVRAGLVPPILQNGEVEQTFTLGPPAPNISNEFSDTFSAGFIWTPSGRLDGLSVQADFWRFEVSDRVLPELPGSAIQPELAAFQQAVQDPNNFIEFDTVAADSATPFQSCDPNTLEAQFGRDSTERLNCVVDPRTYLVSGIQRAATNPNADLITLSLAAINAGEIEADGVDVKLGYNWDTDYGRFAASIDYTHVNQYELSNVPGLDLGLLDTGIFDAAGTSGDGNIVRSLPDNKGNLTLSWQNGNHGATVINRHIGSYQDLAFQNVIDEANDFVRSRARSTIDSYDTWDIQYRYTANWSDSLGSTQFTFGVLDLFNEDIPTRELNGLGLTYDATVFDPRGRRLYVRALWAF